LSLDSLSIYKEIDIVSAKPTIEERDGIEHYGIDLIYPNEAFDVTIFIKLYKNIYNIAKNKNKNLIIVGGSSFYLKSLIDGISPFPTISQDIKDRVTYLVKYEISQIYQMLSKIDGKYMAGIANNDKYRIEKALSIYLSTKQTPTDYFRDNPAKSVIIGKLPIYSIHTDREILLKRIKIRTKKMIERGLIDEVAYLEKRYNRSPNSMKSIGIKETLDYFDGRLDINRLEERIVINTRQLAKRQNTFNNSQFKDITALELMPLKEKIELQLNNR